MPQLPTANAGLLEGKTYSPAEVGEAAGRVAPAAGDAEDDEEEEGLEDEGQGREAAEAAATAAAAASTSAREQRLERQQQQRQRTLAKKQQGQQKHLTFMAYEPAVLERLPAFVQRQVRLCTGLR